LIVRRRVAFLVLPGQAQIAGNENGTPGGLARDSDGGAVDLAEAVGVADLGQLVLAGVEGEDLQHLRAGVDELLVQNAEGVGMLYSHFRRERPRLYIAAVF